MRPGRRHNCKSESKEAFLMKRVVGIMVAGSLTMAALGEEPARSTSEKGIDKPVMLSYADLKWVELPERKGMQFAVLSGDPKTGAYTQMRRVPALTANPLHSHSSELKNVIISGVWYTGADVSSARDFGPGSVVVMPANWIHVSGCRAGAECVFYQEGNGRFDFKPAGSSTQN